MENRWLWIAFGVISIIGGIFALLNPFAATLAVDLMAGYLFMFVGIGWLISTFGETTWRGRIMSLLTGAVITWLGVSLVMHPLAGIVSLTIVTAISIAFAGIFKIAVGLSLRTQSGSWVVIFSGLLSVALAIMIFANFQAAAATLLGVLLAIELISNGTVMITIAAAAKKLSDTVEN